MAQTPLGKQLIGFARLSVLVAECEAAINADIVMLFGKKEEWPIGPQKIETQIQQTCSKLMATPGLNELP